MVYTQKTVPQADILYFVNYVNLKNRKIFIKDTKIQYKGFLHI
jgi:hypothetical protein